ncbi:hypothetical protein HPB51_006730 [Rhipicephalus microplus]|uniref:Uncharacterized protein n=1 Tax=Rhipicephalus microplus TaxID=6941 RepID=A0A9J6E7P2_RHIMP|nr:hypothetical protein HPB51_006730 [Rhipicephalus microplus]
MTTTVPTIQQKRAADSSTIQGATTKDYKLRDESTNLQEVMLVDSGDPMDVQSSVCPVVPAKRGPPVIVHQQDAIASGQSLKKVMHPRSPLLSLTTCPPVPITSVPTKHVQKVIDHALETNGYKGFAAYKSTNTINVHLAAHNDAQKLCSLTPILLSDDRQLPVQCYFASGPNVQKCVFYDIDPDDSPEIICHELYSPTHRVLAARIMGKRRTCLVTMQSP